MIFSGYNVYYLILYRSSIRLLHFGYLPATNYCANCQCTLWAKLFLSDHFRKVIFRITSGLRSFEKP